MQVVHVLLGGQPLCGFTRNLPKDWPEGHVWTWEEDEKNVTCENCKELSKERKNGKPA